MWDNPFFIFMSENFTKITLLVFFSFTDQTQSPFKHLDNFILSAGLSFNTTMQEKFLLLFSSCWEM